MNKYAYSSKMAILDLAAYPSRFFTNVWVDGISLLVYFFLWQALFSSRDVVNGYTLRSITTYYAIVFTIRKLTNSKTITRRISNNIRYGTMSIFFLQPISFIKHYFFRIFTQISFQTLIPFILLIVLTYGIQILEKPSNIILFFVSLLLASVITFLFYAITGCMAFWTIKAWGINSMIGRFVAILSGAVIPLNFFPNSFQNINSYLPFKHMSYTPASIYLGTLSGQEAVVNVSLQIFWLIFMIVLFKIIWKRAVFKYDSVGG